MSCTARYRLHSTRYYQDSLGRFFFFFNSLKPLNWNKENIMKQKAAEIFSHFWMTAGCCCHC